MSVRSQLTTFHWFPPSSERQSEPWSAVWISAYTRLESVGATATSILPTGEWGRPAVRCVQESPPLCVTYTPLPAPPLNIAHVFIETSHVPAKTVFGSCASIDMPE